MNRFVPLMWLSCTFLVLVGPGWRTLNLTREAHAADVPAEPQFATVFASGEHGYALIRTPQILVTRDGSLLVFAQGRAGEHDQSANDIILKRSTDGGATWSPLLVIAEDGENSLNSICVLQVRETGRILVVGCVIPAGHNISAYEHLSPGMKEYYRRNERQDWPSLQTGYGPSSARVYTVHSDDDGRTWSAMRDITESAKPPEVALTCVPGPGLGIQLRRGPHAGRIVIPCNQLWLEPAPERPRYRNAPYAVFSDDQGSTWQRGNKAMPDDRNPGLSANETQVAELDDGTIQLNTRTFGRAVAYSRDGGEHWSPLVDEPTLKGPACAAGFLRYSSRHDGEKGRLLFSLPMLDGRHQGTVWLSYDDGRTWPVSKTLRPDRFKYSCLARLPDDTIGCVFGGVAAIEEDGTTKNGYCIILAFFTLEWLTDGRDRTGT